MAGVEVTHSTAEVLMVQLGSSGAIWCSCSHPETAMFCAAGIMCLCMTLASAAMAGCARPSEALPVLSHPLLRPLM